jgi:hypothetical protein
MLTVRVKFENNLINLSINENHEVLIASMDIKEAISVFKQIKAILDGEEKVSPIKFKSIYGDFTWDLTKKVLQQIREPLATELNYATGKIKKPEEEKFNIDEYFKKIKESKKKAS